VAGGSVTQTTEDLLRLADIIGAAQDVLRPVEVLSPAEWAERYREVVGGPFPGPWDNTNGPHLVDVMNAVQEALHAGRDLVVMKGAQEGVTEALGVNAVAWLLHYYGGPILYLTSKDDTAKKLSRDRWDNVLETCEPLKAKHLAGKAKGELILAKRFTDGQLNLCGSRSMNNYLSNPYAVVVFDELDACQDEMPDGSDPIALIRQRLTAMAEGRDVLMIAFAHPTTKERGAARLYYEESDQRRGHVLCPHCSTWMAPLWKHVQVTPRAGQSQAQAERDPTCYELAAPCCGAVLSEADRLKMIQRIEQRSTLAPEVAATKRWIGLHTWHLFLRKGGRIRELARDYVAALDNPGHMVVFVNKTTGDGYEVSDQETTAEAWAALVREDFKPGVIPPEVSFLTAGQDSRLLELHWTVWGWGLVRTSGGVTLLCGWLVDFGVEPGPAATDRARKTLDASDLHVFDQVLYDRFWPRQDDQAEHLPVRMGLHDSGWQPIAIYEYARTRPEVAFPSKGAAEDDRARAPAVTWAPAPKWRIDDEEISDPNLKRADLNTFMLKVDILGQVHSRFTPAAGGAPRARLALPDGVPPTLLQQLASERLVSEGGKKMWRRRGPNHWLDCTIQAYAAALQLAPFLNGETRDEHLAEARAQAEARARRGIIDPGPAPGPAPRPGPHRPRPVRRRY
jgi:phage terminase large subunit GpA-like protein